MTTRTPLQIIQQRLVIVLLLVTNAGTMMDVGESVRPEPVKTENAMLEHVDVLRMTTVI